MHDSITWKIILKRIVKMYGSNKLENLNIKC